MTKYEFDFKSKCINEKLDYISSCTANMAWKDIAKPSNPEFSELMKLQQKLIEASDKLIEKYYKQS